MHGVRRRLHARLHWCHIGALTRLWCRQVLTEQMRADDAQQLLMRRVRWAYTRDDQGRKWPRVNDKRQDKRGHGPNSGRLTKTAEKARAAMIKRDAATLSPLRLQARSADELRDLDFASAPVITPRNECRNAIIKQRVLEFARVHGKRAVRYRATDHVQRGKRAADDDSTVWRVFENYEPGCGDQAVAELADYHGVKGNSDDNDTRACAKVRLSRRATPI
jgi:hypothetical protein